MYPVSDKKTRSLGKSNFDVAIEKCEKAIKRHSIKKRPVSNVNKKRTEKEKAYLAQKEFNPFLKNAWLLMGKAQYQKGDFIEAASTFNYILRLYSTQPEIVAMARAYLSRCYVALEWAYDAEDVFNKMGRDSITPIAQKQKDASYSGYLILQERYKEAIPYLEKTIKNEKRKKQKARLNFLLGQLYHTTGNPQLAYNALKKVVRSNPPYELEFNARVLQSEVMSKGQSKQMIKKLQRMVRNPKNKELLDQVYYAIGNIYLASKDTVHTIGAYETGAEKSTRNGLEKGVLLLHLGNIYWGKEDYINAQRCYSQAVNLLDKEREEYTETARRAKILDELAPHLSAVKLQDSLQALALMAENQRTAAIDRVIEALKKKEKEEAKKENATRINTQTGSTIGGNRNTTIAPPQSNMQKDGAWYFYNPMTISQGKTEFEKRWGKRINEDNWRISNKRGNGNSGEKNQAETVSDSLDTNHVVQEEKNEEEKQRIADSIANDPHEREYYLKQIPFAEDQLKSSHLLLSDGLYHAGILEMEKLENFELAYKTLQRLLTEYPEYEKMDNIYYHLFLLNARFEEHTEAAKYKQLLISQYPESPYSLLLNKPNYEEFARNGKHLEDSLYTITYEAYKKGNYNDVIQNYKKSTLEYAEGKHRAKFMFIHAMSQLYTGHRSEFLASLKEVIEKYPEDEITSIANEITKGIQEGRSLTDGKFDVGSIWARRALTVSSDSASAGSKLTNERYCNFVFLLAYPVNSLDEDQLLYELARYNFSNFTIRNFDIEVVKQGGVNQMQVKGFLSFDEVHTYTQKLFGISRMAQLLKNIRVVLISEDNLKLLGSVFSFDDYKTFYDEEFAPLQIPDELRLDKPTTIEIRTEDDDDEESTPTKEKVFEDY